MRIIPSKQWMGQVGDEYIERNPKTIEEMEEQYKKEFGFTRTFLNEEFIGKLRKDMRILEVGCGIGLQLIILQKMGFKNLYGADISRTAVDKAKQFKGIDVMQADAQQLPFKDGYFDMVFTTRFLIHVDRFYVKETINEIARCSNSYIWGFEYYHDFEKEILYQGYKDMLWKDNYKQIYSHYHNLKFIKAQQYKNIEEPKKHNIDEMFLLEKKED